MRRATGEGGVLWLDAGDLDPLLKYILRRRRGRQKDTKTSNNRNAIHSEMFSS